MLVFTSSQSGYVKGYFFGVNDFTHEEGLTSKCAAEVKGVCRSFSLEVDGRNFQATLCLGWKQLKTSEVCIASGSQPADYEANLKQIC